MGTICMKCQILFSGKIGENISKYHLPKFLPSMQSIHGFCLFQRAHTDWIFDIEWLDDEFLVTGMYTNTLLIHYCLYMTLLLGSKAKQFIMTPVQEPDSDNLGKSFRFSI